MTLPQQQNNRNYQPVKRNQGGLISLRIKILLGFSIIFSVVFAGAFYWFYAFSTERTISRLRADMKATLVGAAQGVDVQELMALYANGKPNASGFSDDRRFQRQLAWFETVHSIEPRAWLYTYTTGKAQNNRHIGKPAVEPNELEIIYLVDLWARYNPSKSVRFLEAGAPGSVTQQVLERGELVENQDIYTDKWGTWLSAFAPLKSADGEIVAILGVDLQADYVLSLQQQIRKKVWVTFAVTYAILFVLIYLLSGILTKHLTELTQAAEKIAEGDYNQTLSFANQTFLADEMNTLAQVFEVMIDSIRAREQLIREGKQTEDEIRRALREEKELGELKSRFVSMTSHEFRTPLTTIRTAIEILERYGDVASDVKKSEYFQRIRTAIQTINQLVEDVLIIGKAEAGKLEFNPEWLDLESLCREVIEEIRLGISTNQTITFTQSGYAQQAYVDPKLLRSILINLLSNAVKYSTQKSTIRLKLFYTMQSVCFEIHDQGIGIPIDDQSQLFELFHRASNVDKIRGTGLGLAIVKQCVERHQGRITFTSQENIGTTFCVELPLNVEQPEAQA